MPNENNLLPEHAQLAAVLDNPDAIQRIKEPTEKLQIAAVQKSRKKMFRLFTNATEKVQLSAVIASPESVLLMQAPSPWPASRPWKVFKADLPPTTGILAAARRLVFRMKGNRKLGEPDTEAVKEFFDEVKSFKH